MSRCRVKHLPADGAKAIPVDDGTCNALLVVVDEDGKERALIRYRSMTKALADRDYLDMTRGSAKCRSLDASRAANTC
jgi:hypothetical protein